MATMPHCDSRVLHAPAECTFCDRYPEWQEYRRLLQMAFTGHEPAEGELPCPSTLTRPLDAINAWPGNRPITEQEAKAQQKHWSEFIEKARRRWPNVLP